MRRLFSLSRCSIFAFVALLSICLLQNTVGERNGATALLTYFPQHGFGALPFLLLLLCLKARARRLAWLNGASLAFWMFALLGFQLPSLRFDHPKTLRILTYNVLGGHANASQIARDVRNQKPDIVCLQESQGGFGARVAAQFPGWTQKSAGDVTTFSRFPLVSSDVHAQLGRRRLLETVWQTPQGKVRVLTVHISMQPRGKATNSSSKLKRILTENRAKAMARMEQLTDIERLPNNGMPTLLCGDFNTPPRGLFYRGLARNWKDAFAQSGFGLGQTYPAAMPLLRIDYVWMRGLGSRSARVVDAGGSDHRALVCEVFTSN